MNFIFLFLLIANCSIAFTQCVTPISSFPYFEDFESGNGNWLPSSTDHWEWGQIISKPVISAAGGGQKCWVAGGLSGSFYSSGSSTLQSPCFNISSLVYPQISFKVFWETEKRYDGAVLSYSLDGGTVWQNLGTINSNTDCIAENWYNHPAVNFVGSAGWSGNVQSTSGSCLGGDGNGVWLTAKHSLESFTGATSVVFRFRFGAGLTCNAYDGFAIDDIMIGEAPTNTADFTYNCNPGNSVTFSGSSGACKTGQSWNFGDPASGTSNISTLDNPVHVFSVPGNYMITLNTFFATGAPVLTVKNITVVNVSAAVVNAIKCNGNQNGSIAASVSPAGMYNFNWDTNPPTTTPALMNIPAGTYTVTVTGNNTCTVSIPVSLTQPDALSISTAITDAKCNTANAAITATVTGGVLPYIYAWSNAANTPTIKDLAAGNYSLTVTDANGCTQTTPLLKVNNIVILVNVSLGSNRTICTDEKIILNPGKYSSYTWQDNSTGPTLEVSSAGIYTVHVTDSSGCMGNATVNITQAECGDIYFPNAFSPNGDGRNDFFGPLPLNAISSLRRYTLTVYGRWGEVVFISRDPYIKWDGKLKGRPFETNTFTWVASYTQNNLLPVTQKGTVTIIR